MREGPGSLHLHFFNMKKCIAANTLGALDKPLTSTMLVSNSVHAVPNQDPERKKFFLTGSFMKYACNIKMAENRQSLLRQGHLVS